MPIFMQYDGIEGDVSSAGHEKWIELSSLQFGVARAMTSPTASAADREATTPSVSEIVVTKAQDKASVMLFQASLYGEGKTVQIDFVRTNNGNPEVYLTYKLTNCMVSSFSMSSGGDRPTESLSLNFTKIEYSSTAGKEDLSEGSPDRAEYDLATQTGS